MRVRVRVGVRVRGRVRVRVRVRAHGLAALGRNALGDSDGADAAGLRAGDVAVVVSGSSG